MADEAHSTNRRAFLSHLASLPLVGGALLLSGRPTGVAVPVTRDLLLSYDFFLLMERRFLAHELFPEDVALRRYHLAGNGITREAEQFFFPSGKRWDEGAMPSGRAAVILSAAGVPV